MPELSLHNIDQISRDLRKQDITFSHLLEELIDHVCCDVEYEMQNGLDFSEAYKKVKKKIGSRRIKEIQEETLYLVDTKYRKMKNLMKISGITGTIMYGFAALFKIQHWAGAGIMMTLGALILAFLFMPSALSVLWKETHNRKRIFLFISAFFAALFFISGTLFKIQHWPGAGIILSLAALSAVVFFIPALMVSRISDQENRAKRPAYITGATGIIFYITGMFFKIQHWPTATILMVLGVIVLCVVAFPWYTWITWKDEKHIKSRFIYLVIGSLLIIVPGALLNLNLQRSYDEGFYSLQAQQQEMSGYLYSNNNSLLKMYHDSSVYQQMEQIHNQTKELLSLIGSVQVKMVQESEGKPVNIAIGSDKISQTETGPLIKYSFLTAPFATAPVRDYLLPACTTRQELNAAVLQYKEFISGINPGKDLTKFENLLDPSNYLPKEISENSGNSLMTGLHSLEVFKNGILTFEWQMLTAVANNR
jgi:hypothetical protein